LRFTLPGSTVGQPGPVSSNFQARTFVIVFAARPSTDYCLLTPGRKSAWGVLSLGRTDVGE